MAVIDSSTLIYLTKASCKEILAKMHNVIAITPKVYEETVIMGKNYPESTIIEENISNGIIKVESPQKILRGLPESLGSGEKEAISAAFERDLLLISDDVHAIRVALSFGLNVRTSETLLIEAYIKGLISLEELKRKISALMTYKSLRPDVYVLLNTLLRIFEEEEGSER